MTRDKDKKPGKEQQLLEAARLGQVSQLETILNQFQQHKTKKRSNPLASLRKCVGPNNIRDPVTGFTCLHHAALNGHSQCVQLIISHGGKLNAVDYKGSTALHLAAWSGNLQVVKTLMGYLSGAQTSPGSHRISTAASGQTSETAAATKIAQSTAQPIKSSSPKQTKSSSQQAVASLDGAECFQEIELDHRNNDNQTALSLAAQFGHSQVVAELLVHGADPNLRNNQLESPLDLACLNGHLETVQVLLNSSAHLAQELRKSHATISISTFPFSHMQQQQPPPPPQLEQDESSQRRPVAGGWSSLLRGSTMKELSFASSSSFTSSPTSASNGTLKQRRATMAPGTVGKSRKGDKLASAQQLQQQQHYSLDSSPSPSISERLLDHSPLHYAVRRGHLPIIDLLLSQYEANLYQLTSLGSVMHEMVMGNHQHSSKSASESGAHSTNSSANNYPHGDIMRVFLAHLGRMSAGNLEETRTRWQHLLSARNGQQRDVFEMLNDINNRHAQELKCSILQLSDQLELNFTGQRQQQHQPARQQELIANAHHNQQQQLQQMQQAQQRQVFGNSQHLNSFVTMKRAPKQQQQQQQQQRQQHQRLGNEDFNQRDASQGERGHHEYERALPDGTQTIDRRRPRPVADPMRQYPLRPMDQQQLMDAHQAGAYLASQQQVGIARSISDLLTQNELTAAAHQRDMTRPSTINWPEMFDSATQQSKMAPEVACGPLLSAQQIERRIEELERQKLAITSLQAMKRRSKSRDLGTILMQASSSAHNQNHHIAQAGDVQGATSQDEQLYDNQLLPSMESPAPNQLVRSQTDCSHLLGRFFGDASQQQGAAVHQPHLQRRMRAADFARQHNQQQQQQQPTDQHALSSENSSTHISSLANQEPRLVPTSIAQQHSATLDRRAINRHYHVYEYEFYPPRLVSHQVQHSTSAAAEHAALLRSPEKHKQTVAIVPPILRNEMPGSDHDATAQMQHQVPINNSRLSLNMEQQQQQQPVAMHGYPEMLADNRQQDQMNRFVGRSRKSASGIGAASNRMQQQLTVDTGELIDTRLRQQQPWSALQRPQSMHSSQSLESRLGADSQQQQVQSFESTRRALMRDFDKMIGRELLNNGDNNYSDQHSSDASQSVNSRRIVHSESASSQNSILTGVSLDMDTRGEHLIVSGTRITMPPDLTTSSRSVSSGSMKSSPSSCRTASHQARDVSPRDLCVQTPRVRSQMEEADAQSLSSASASSSRAPSRQAPPQKPPRPSIESQQTYRSQQVHQQAARRDRPVIYDMPSVDNRRLDSSDTATGSRRPGSRTSVINSTASSLVATPITRPPPVPPQPKPRKSGSDHNALQQQASMTEPPSEKPPPPPPPAVQLASPAADSLTSPIAVMTNPHEVLTGSRRARPPALSAKMSLSSSSSCNSPTSSTSSSFKLISQRPDEVLLTDGTARQRLPNASGGISGSHQNANRAPDADSGICTSNSPATSTSHESESGSSQDNRAPFGIIVDEQSKSSSCAGSVIMAPPSPRTALMSIEEALMPLEQTLKIATTQEVANQTGPCDSCDEASDEDYVGGDDDDEDVGHERCFVMDDEIEEQATSLELGSQVDEIFGWLSSSTASKNCSDERPSEHQQRQLELPTTEKLVKDGYENCNDLQKRLRAARCRSIGSLLNDVSASQRDAYQASASRVSLSSSSSSSKSLSNGSLRAREAFDLMSSSSQQNNDHASSIISEQPSSSLVYDKTAQQSATSPTTRHCKEITLRIVVDESQQAAGGDGVFYISPLELKKISSNTAKNELNDASQATKSEAETMTDEELCASVDKSSGYIRFTLRKRRVAGASSDDDSAKTNDSSLPGKQAQAEDVDLGYDLKSSVDPETSFSSCAKRTKMNDSRQQAEDKIKLQEDDNLSEANKETNCENMKDMQQVIEDERTNEDNDDQERPKEAQRKASSDSVTMDTSQASSSSSNSEMSIKSIVSLKVQQQQQQLSTVKVDESSLAPQASIDRCQQQQQQQCERAFDAQADSSKDSCEQIPKAVSAESNNERRAEKEEEAEFRRKLQKPETAPKLAPSIVSETARKLEAVAQSGRDSALVANRPPTAATRRVLVGNAQGADKENVKPALFVPPLKKSICWPPKKTDDARDLDETRDRGGSSSDETTSANRVAAETTTTTTTPTGPIIGRVTANRLSFQRLIEEKNKAASASSVIQPALGRPKPPPPIKPAGLIAPQRFKSQV